MGYQGVERDYETILNAAIEAQLWCEGGTVRVVRAAGREGSSSQGQDRLP